MIGAYMLTGIRHLKHSGKTVIDALVAIAAIALMLAVILPALAKERDDARIVQCADNLKQFGQAAHQYAADFEGKFFYNRSRTSDHKRQHKPEIAGMWYDAERIGRYIDGKIMYYQWYGPRAGALKEKPPGEPPADWPQAGLGGGVFVCPSDTEEAGRSYDMN